MVCDYIQEKLGALVSVCVTSLGEELRNIAFEQDKGLACESFSFTAHCTSPA
jgi:hypothetical protein